MPRNVSASRYPNAIMGRNMIKKARQRPQPAGAPRQTAMQTNRHHSGAMGPK